MVEMRVSRGQTISSRPGPPARSGVARRVVSKGGMRRLGTRTGPNAPQTWQTCSMDAFAEVEGLRIPIRRSTRGGGRLDTSAVAHHRFLLALPCLARVSKHSDPEVMGV